MIYNDKELYKKFVDSRSPKSPTLVNCAAAFWVGGLICTGGQLLLALYEYFGMDEKSASLLVTVTLIFLTALFTAIGTFDAVAKYAGAGTVVPVTGFANSVASPAIDTKSEGLVLGVGAKIFTVAGPVLLYGTLSGAIFGVFYYIYKVIT